MTGCAGVTVDGRLVSEAEWVRQVDALQASTVMTGDKQHVLQHLGAEFTAAVQKRLPPQHVGVLFSGGVDSTAIAAVIQQLGGRLTCYTVGFEGAKDVEAAATVAASLRLDSKTRMLSLQDVEKLLHDVLAIIPGKDVVNVEVAVTALAAIEFAVRHGDTHLFSGLGSEEIFAGYQRHAEAEDVNAECWRGLRLMWQRDLQRDAALASASEVSLLTPFLDRGLIAAAMSVPGAWKIVGSDKKVIFREASIACGVPRQFAFRRKLAAQYGSSVSKAVAVLAKRYGFRYKKDYLASLLP